jgi:hypothetical protein
MERVHLVVACSNRKSVPPPARNRLRSLPKGPIEDRVNVWWKRIAMTKERTLASELYQGDHWCVACDLSAVARAQGLRPRLWVMSAGHGLIGADVPIASYSATFATGHLDSIARGREPAQETGKWWTLLSRKKLKDGASPRTFAALASSDRRARVVVVASLEYLRAAENDLCSAVGTLASRERLLIVSSRGEALTQELTFNVVRPEARLRQVLGGGAQSLNARVARWMLSDSRKHGLEPTVMRLRLQRLLKGVPPVLTHNDRKAITDDELLSFLRKELASSAKVGWTTLLRKLRQNGLKCEQGRFRDLYRQAKEDTGG